MDHCCVYIVGDLLGKKITTVVLIKLSLLPLSNLALQLLIYFIYLFIYIVLEKK